MKSNQNYKKNFPIKFFIFLDFLKIFLNPLSEEDLNGFSNKYYAIRKIIDIIYETNISSPTLFETHSNLVYDVQQGFNLFKINNLTIFNKEDFIFLDQLVFFESNNNNNLEQIRQSLLNLEVYKNILKQRYYDFYLEDSFIKILFSDIQEDICNYNLINMNYKTYLLFDYHKVFFDLIEKCDNLTIKHLISNLNLKKEDFSISNKIDTIYLNISLESNFFNSNRPNDIKNKKI